MKRRALLVMALALPFAALGQGGRRVHRLGLLSVAPSSGVSLQVDRLRAGLRELGLTEGREFTFELRSADGKYERLADLAGELVRLEVDVLVAFGTPATRAAMGATKTVPIVMVGAGDPVASGLVESLARPGGNVTGSSNLSPVLMVKRLELLKEAYPDVRRVAVLLNPANPAQRFSLDAMNAAAQPLKMELFDFQVRNLAEIEQAFSEMRKQRVEGVAVANDTMLIANTRRIAELAAKGHLLSVGHRELADMGGLLGYGSIIEVYGHSATYIARILRGAKPSGLPVEQPSKVDLVVNRRTARAIGVSIPQRMLFRADRVIE